MKTTMRHEKGSGDVLSGQYKSCGQVSVGGKNVGTMFAIFIFIFHSVFFCFKKHVLFSRFFFCCEW